MNPLTSQFLTQLWADDPSFAAVASRLRKECKTMAPAEAAVIGRDLILRRRALYTRDFKLAAYLASDSLAGNDGFMDFTDCVALLPEDRYQRILATPDELIDDPVSTEFDELNLVSQVSQVFDRALLAGDEDESLLDYLVFGQEEIHWDEIQGATEEDARARLPRLYAKFGHVLQESKPSGDKKAGSTLTMEDFFGPAGPPKQDT
jgi:hypothetical protein